MRKRTLTIQGNPQQLMGWLLLIASFQNVGPTNALTLLLALISDLAEIFQDCTAENEKICKKLMRDASILATGLRPIPAHLLWNTW
jgi:hypothetical protein